VTKTKPQRPVVENEDRDDVQDDAIIGKAMLGSLAIIAIVGMIAGSVAVMVYLRKPVVIEKKTELAETKTRAVEQVQLPVVPLIDITTESGIDWKHVNGMEGEKLLPETMGGGVAVFDYDRDGDNDLLFVGGTNWPWAKSPIANPRSLCLYRNNGAARFDDVTKQVGLDRNLYGSGPCVGDFDNDGWQDLFITAVGKNVLFRNNQGKFEDITDASGIAIPETGCCLVRL
jgi:enediyne biosynthesis protein E4